jgi:hypothetical protein
VGAWLDALEWAARHRVAVEASTEAWLGHGSCPYRDERLAGRLSRQRSLSEGLTSRSDDAGHSPNQQRDGQESCEAGQRLGIAKLRPEELGAETSL